MKKFVVRGVLAPHLVGAVGLATVSAASAGTLAYQHQQEDLPRRACFLPGSRSAIEATFRASVASARANYQESLASATTSAERGAAQQTMQEAIINAAGVRARALSPLVRRQFRPPCSSQLSVVLDLGHHGDFVSSNVADPAFAVRAHASLDLSSPIGD